MSFEQAWATHEQSLSNIKFPSTDFVWLSRLLNDTNKIFSEENHQEKIISKEGNKKIVL